MNQVAIEDIAELCHEMNRTYCACIGDSSQKSWKDSPDWQKKSAINGVKFHLENPKSNPEDSHINWMKQKTAEGWVYGLEKDPVKKTHPCLKPYEELSMPQKAKDVIFITTVKTLDRLSQEAR